MNIADFQTWELNRDNVFSMNNQFVEAVEQKDEAEIQSFFSIYTKLIQLGERIKSSLGESLRNDSPSLHTTHETIACIESIRSDIDVLRSWVKRCFTARDSNEGGDNLRGGPPSSPVPKPVRPDTDATGVTLPLVPEEQSPQFIEVGDYPDTRVA